MITVLGTDITLYVIFAVGFFIGRMQGQVRRLRLENAALKKSKQPAAVTSYNTEAGR